jgi:hypothetical protein
VAIDTSGQILRDSDVWIVALRMQNQPKHTGVYINNDYQNDAKNIIMKNWVDKLYAILLYRTSNTLLESNDIIQIDKDFHNKRAKKIQEYMERLFGVFNVGTDRTKPIIQFLPPKYSKPVREAHKLSQSARHGKVMILQNPNITKEMNCLRSL